MHLKNKPALCNTWLNYFYRDNAAWFYIKTILARKQLISWQRKLMHLYGNCIYWQKKFSSRAFSLIFQLVSHLIQVFWSLISQLFHGTVCKMFSKLCLKIQMFSSCCFQRLKIEIAVKYNILYSVLQFSMQNRRSGCNHYFILKVSFN